MRRLEKNRVAKSLGVLVMRLLSTMMSCRKLKITFPSGYNKILIIRNKKKYILRFKVQNNILNLI